MKLAESLSGFKDRKILIVGDVMLDRYLYGEVHRISPEAPVPVLDYQRTVYRLGGAANVALNVKAMGGAASIVGLIGTDEEGEIFSDLLRSSGIDGTGMVRSGPRSTTLKTRVMARNQHLLRVDREDKGPVDPEITEALWKNVGQRLENETVEGVILQDYNKGVLSEFLIRKTIALAGSKNIPVFVDPKKDNISAYSHCTLFKPNLNETEQITGMKVRLTAEDLAYTADALQQILNHDISMITLSDRGLFAKEKERPGHWIPSIPQNVTDVCGAGDSVISALALSYLTGVSVESMAKIANIAGHLACRYPGVVPISWEELNSELEVYQSGNSVL